MSCFEHESAYIDEPCEIDGGTNIDFCDIQKGSNIGSNCVFGQNCSVTNDVVIGSNVKAHNNVSIYTGTTIEGDVFLGPSFVLANKQGIVRCLDLDENSPLPESLRVGDKPYGAFRPRCR